MAWEEGGRESWDVCRHSVYALSPSHMMHYVPLAFCAQEVCVAVITVSEWML